MTEEKTTLMEISILRHNSKALLRGILPDNCISRLLQPDFTHMP